MSLPEDRYSGLSEEKTSEVDGFLTLNQANLAHNDMNTIPNLPITSSPIINHPPLPSPNTNNNNTMDIRDSFSSTTSSSSTSHLNSPFLLMGGVSLGKGYQP